MRAQIALAPGAVAPDDAWYSMVLASRLAIATECTMRGSDCVLLTPDLRGDGRHQALLCDVEAQAFVTVCQLFARDAQAQWKPVESMTFPPLHPGSNDAVREPAFGAIANRMAVLAQRQGRGHQGRRRLDVEVRYAAGGFVDIVSESLIKCHSTGFSRRLLTWNGASPSMALPWK
ncbi:MAG TPA: hypothetical protein VJ722_12070 [Rhodanobacteraceae bacterium]|nr:hypothetical protein [Rhodanobacteraceae bacterium]